ncbi:MAG TPA: LacI family transcriptional regulator [Alphaproteobacteria bacterium]|nr:LacI family transcriptional regulator [Alphaproteobacteria bacterium]
MRVEDVAREAGVSPITVSRALSNPEKVKEDTRRRVNEAVQKTGYVINRFASSLRSGRSTIISAFVSNLSNPHFANAIQGCADALEGSRYHLLMAQIGYGDRLQGQIVDEVLTFRPAAVLFTGIVQSRRTRTTLKKLGVPVMEMWDHRPDPIDMLVGFSNAEGGRLVGEHFAARGYRTVAYVGRTQDRGAQRLTGFTAGLGRAPDFVLPLEGSRTMADGEAALETVLAALPDCEAIFFGTDLLAVGAMARARQEGIAVPGRVAIAGYGDLEISRQLATPLTTVHVSSYEMGHAAGEMLLRRLRHEPIAERIVLAPVHLEIRQSTGG